MSRRGRHSSPFSLFSFQDIITCVTAIFILMTLILTIELLQRKLKGAANSLPMSTAELQQAVEQADAEIERLKQVLAKSSSQNAELSNVLPAEVESKLAQTENEVQRLEKELALLGQHATSVDKTYDLVVSQRFQRHQQVPDLEQFHKQAEEVKKQIERVKSGNVLVFNPTSRQGKRAWIVDVSESSIIVSRIGQPNSRTEFRDLALNSQSAQLGRWLQDQDSALDYFLILIRPSGIKNSESVRSTLSTHGFPYGFDVIGPTQTIVAAETSAP